jgi:hypothetical protein
LEIGEDVYSFFWAICLKEKELDKILATIDADEEKFEKPG